MGKEQEMPQNNGCCCECREKTWLEIVAERVTDEHERQIIVREFARQHEENERLQEQVKDLKNYNDGLCLEVSRLSYYVKNVEFREAEARHNSSRNWFIDYLMRELKELESKKQ